MAFYGAVNNTTDTNEDYDAGAAKVWELIGDFLGTTAAERKSENLASVASIAELLAKYTPESLAQAMKKVIVLREAKTFRQGDILVISDGIRVTIITSNSATGYKEGVTPTGKCYTITNVFDWKKTGETNQGLIAAWDDIDAEEPGGGE